MRKILGSPSGDQILFPHFELFVILKTALIACLFCLALLPCWSAADELPDDSVYKAVEVVIRDSTVTIKYFVGVNEATQAKILESWQTDQLSISDTEKLEKQFRQQMLKRLSERLKVEVNGKQVSLVAKTATDPGKHHYTGVAELEFQLSAGANKISIIDEEFSNLQTTARYSLKALGATILNESNVAPIIIRAKRHEFEPGKTKRRSKHSAIHASVLTITPSTSKPPRPSSK